MDATVSEYERPDDLPKAYWGKSNVIQSQVLCILVTNALTIRMTIFPQAIFTFGNEIFVMKWTMTCL